MNHRNRNREKKKEEKDEEKEREKCGNIKACVQLRFLIKQSNKQTNNNNKTKTAIGTMIVTARNQATKEQL